MKLLKYLILMGIPFFTYAKAPQVAIGACESKVSGDSCSFSSPRNTVEGICRQPPAQKQLVCVPARKAGNQLLSRANGQEQIRAPRKHTIVQSDGQVETTIANVEPITDSKISTRIEGDERILIANGISEHFTGQFPNSGNPNEIKEQSYTFKIPANPKISGKITPLGLHDFGLGLNGVPFDPIAAEWYLGDRSSGWQYEAMSGAVELGLDENHAHVQPSGAYHYHALPTLLVSDLHLSSEEYSPLIGWSADGFPIYALYGYKNPEDKQSGIVEQTSSYQLKSGHRPDGGSNPGGHYDGTFVADYEYVKGAGSLDECNGQVTTTPEFPNGIYAYFLTEAFPVIPRCYKGTPSTDFTQQRVR
ncbi:YHYH protein [Marinomonas colpomeniae]|nr:YHYH protein [Marinomonas colpomeniae]